MNILYGIKNCDTVKKARLWLEQNNVAFHFHDFRVDGLTQTQVNDWIHSIGLENLVNKRSTTWKELDQTTRENFTAQNAAAVIVMYPTLIKRPLLDTGSQQHLGFKDAEYASIFH